MSGKLTERQIFDHVFNKLILDKNKLKLLEENPDYKELREYYESLKKLAAEKNQDDVEEIAKKLRKKINPGN